MVALPIQNGDFQFANCKRLPEGIWVNHDILPCFKAWKWRRWPVGFSASTGGPAAAYFWCLGLGKKTVWCWSIFLKRSKTLSLWQIPEILNTLHVKFTTHWWSVVETHICQARGHDDGTWVLGSSQIHSIYSPCVLYIYIYRYWLVIW